MWACDPHRCNGSDWGHLGKQPGGLCGLVCLFGCELRAVVDRRIVCEFGCGKTSPNRYCGNIIIRRRIVMGMLGHVVAYRVGVGYRVVRAGVANARVLQHREKSPVGVRQRCNAGRHRRRRWNGRRRGWRWRRRSGDRHRWRWSQVAVVVLTWVLAWQPTTVRRIPLDTVPMTRSPRAMRNHLDRTAFGNRTASR